MSVSYEDVYNEFLSRVKLDYGIVESKIKKCYLSLKDYSKFPFQLETDIKTCCQKEISEFHDKWFFVSVKQLENTKWYYLAAKETFNMYLDLVHLPTKLSNSDDD